MKEGSFSMRGRTWQPLGALPPDPQDFLRHQLRCPRVPKKRPLTACTARGRMHSRRTIDLDIPYPVASPQSQTLFLQVCNHSTESYRSTLSATTGG